MRSGCSLRTIDLALSVSARTYSLVLSNQTHSRSFRASSSGEDDPYNSVYNLLQLAIRPSISSSIFGSRVGGLVEKVENVLHVGCEPCRRIYDSDQSRERSRSSESSNSRRHLPVHHRARRVRPQRQLGRDRKRQRCSGV